MLVPSFQPCIFLQSINNPTSDQICWMSSTCLLIHSLIACALLSNSALAHDQQCVIDQKGDHGSCNSGSADLQSQYDRLMNLPAHLQPAALKSGTAPWNEEQEVWLCPDHRSPSDRRRIDYYTGMDCEEMEVLFSLYRADEMPTQYAFGFDYQSWCKCPGVTAKPEQSCELCPGDDGGIEKENDDTRLNAIFLVSRGGKSIVMSCSQAMEYAFYITNEDRCMDDLKEARTFCCDPLASTKSEEESSQVFSLRDFQITILFILSGAALAHIIVFVAMFIMAKIDKHWYSWEDL
ncbi:unnamed protein product [Cylindrotheca closterium]|uniref:Uncharacterized protein n=1 Tax=Cylindrotheca closterium TaxID=2856 RepID=A0AAD2G1K1_9STRA|nr:unnamed protein product [Cylindrotheca closterium]